MFKFKNFTFETYRSKGVSMATRGLGGKRGRQDSLGFVSAMMRLWRGACTVVSASAAGEQNGGRKARLPSLSPQKTKWWTEYGVSSSCPHGRHNSR
jgi:hypothetical protein